MLQISLVAVVVIAISPLVFPAPSLAQDQDLSRPFEVTFGHIFAMSLEREIATTALVNDWDAPITVDYDADGVRLEIELLGARVDTESAKESLDRFLRELLTTSLARANERVGTSVTENQIMVVYRNRQQWEAIIRYQDGKYQVPK